MPSGCSLWCHGCLLEFSSLGNLTSILIAPKPRSKSQLWCIQTALSVSFIISNSPILHCFWKDQSETTHPPKADCQCVCCIPSFFATIEPSRKGFFCWWTVPHRQCCSVSWSRRSSQHREEQGLYVVNQQNLLHLRSTPEKKKTPMEPMNFEMKPHKKEIIFKKWFRLFHVRPRKGAYFKNETGIKKLTEQGRQAWALWIQQSHQNASCVNGLQHWFRPWNPEPNSTITIKYHQLSSIVINCHHLSSSIMNYHQLPMYVCVKLFYWLKTPNMWSFQMEYSLSRPQILVNTILASPFHLPHLPLSSEASTWLASFLGWKLHRPTHSGMLRTTKANK